MQIEDKERRKDEGGKELSTCHQSDPKNIIFPELENIPTAPHPLNTSFS